MKSDLEYYSIAAFNGGAGLALVFTKHWFGLFSASIGLLMVVVDRYVKRRDAKRNRSFHGTHLQGR